MAALGTDPHHPAVDARPQPPSAALAIFHVPFWAHWRGLWPAPEDSASEITLSPHTPDAPGDTDPEGLARLEGFEGFFADTAEPWRKGAS
ncbi:hypothetical protein [Marinovum sp.]|uniref:hypothetical protein n=1 Tax=Marinovum sp. TaxID=2024839 RepID=UPI002B27BD8B|nr:hypothetical protein [Marinovum sp.]